MPIAMACGNAGILVIDEVRKSIMWEWGKVDSTAYGIDYDPVERHFYLAVQDKILEIDTYTGSIAWKYSNPTFALGLHSLQLLPNGNILVASSLRDTVLEVKKRFGMSWVWRASIHFETPPGYYEAQESGTIVQLHAKNWTHLNYAQRLPNGDTLISLYSNPPSLDKLAEYTGTLLRVDKDGKVIWRWGDKIVKNPHSIVPYMGEYLIADTGNKRLIYLDYKHNRMTREVDFPSEPNCIEVKPDKHLLVSFPSEGKVRELLPKGDILWEYELPEKIRKVSTRVFQIRYIPEWEVRLSDPDREKVEDILRSLGYID